MHLRKGQGRVRYERGVSVRQYALEQVCRLSWWSRALNQVMRPSVGRECNRLSVGRESKEGADLNLISLQGPQLGC